MRAFAAVLIFASLSFGEPAWSEPFRLERIDPLARPVPTLAKALEMPADA